MKEIISSYSPFHLLTNTVYHTVTVFTSVQTNTITTASELIPAACSFWATMTFVFAIFGKPMYKWLEIILNVVTNLQKKKKKKHGSNRTGAVGEAVANVWLWNASYRIAHELILQTAVRFLWFVNYRYIGYIRYCWAAQLVWSVATVIFKKSHQI